MALRADDVDLGRDRALVEQCQEGDLAAFEDLYRRYYGRLFRFCLRRMGDHHEAEEVTQEAFARAYRAMPALRGERRFYPWLSVIASRLCVDTHRRLGRTEPSADIDLGPADLGPDRLEAAVDFDLLQQALDRLSPRHREVLELREREGWSYQRIAEFYGISLGAVEGLLFRARQALRREFTAVAGADVERAGAIPPVIATGWLSRLLGRRAGSGRLADARRLAARSRLTTRGPGARRLVALRLRTSQWAAGLNSIPALAANGLGAAMAVTTAMGLYSAAVSVAMPPPVHVQTMTPAAYTSAVADPAPSSTRTTAPPTGQTSTSAPAARPTGLPVDAGAASRPRHIESAGTATNLYVNDPADANPRAQDNPLVTTSPDGGVVAGLDPAGAAADAVTDAQNYAHQAKEAHP